MEGKEGGHQFLRTLRDRQMKVPQQVTQRFFHVRSTAFVAFLHSPLTIVVPQHNSYDCGVFLLQYLEAFIREPPKDFRFLRDFVREVFANSIDVNPLLLWGLGWIVPKRSANPTCIGWTSTNSTFTLEGSCDTLVKMVSIPHDRGSQLKKRCQLVLDLIDQCAAVEPDATRALCAHSKAWADTTLARIGQIAAQMMTMRRTRVQQRKQMNDVGNGQLLISLLPFWAVWGKGGGLGLRRGV